MAINANLVLLLRPSGGSGWLAALAALFFLMWMMGPSSKSVDDVEGTFKMHRERQKSGGLGLPSEHVRSH